MEQLKVLGTFLNLVDEWDKEELVARRVIKSCSDDSISTNFDEEFQLGGLSDEEIELLTLSQQNQTEVVFFIQDEIVQQVFSSDEYYSYLCGYLKAKSNYSHFSRSDESQFTSA